MNFEFKIRNWFDKFSAAFRGIFAGTRGQNSFAIHLPMAATVISVSLLLRLDSIRFSILLMCIGAVISAELFNSSIEQLSKAVGRLPNQDIGDALDIASGAVLCVVIFSIIIGVFVLLPPILELVSGT